MTLVFLRPETRDVATRVLDIVCGSFCNLCALARGRWLFDWRYISSIDSADELQKEPNSCSLLRSCFIDSCHGGVSKRFHLVSALQSIAGFQCHVIQNRSK